MSEKRFFQDRNEIITWIRDKETWEKLKTDTDVINKLNELAEENNQLKKEIVFLQNNLHDCLMKSRKFTISEMRDALDKMERYE